MAHINLLPWRDWERERKKKEFFGNLAGVLVLGAMLVFLGGWVLDNNIENQQNRNGFLETKIAALDQRIAEIQNLRKQRQELLERMRVIQELQGNR
ncbi:MAG: pilus assembly protein PilN, partial [Pseudomonadales bacterium]|nr:pilus assembly protein PilN [Pseudomonadales bacterium]